MLPRAGLAALVVTSIVIACSSEAKIDNARCDAAGRPGCYTEADCEAYGRAAGCAISGLGSGLASCITECGFAGCESNPTCGAPSGVKDAGPGFDAAGDPVCAAALSEPAGKGLFASKTACAGASEVNINGSIRYTCGCGACPCGFECGSIALSVGGFIGSVCAPARP